MPTICHMTAILICRESHAVQHAGTLGYAGRMETVMHGSVVR